jgi:hypothetical protein
MRNGLGGAGAEPAGGYCWIDRGSGKGGILSAINNGTKKRYVVPSLIKKRERKREKASDYRNDPGHA